MKKKIGIVLDDAFSIQHLPPYPHPTFFSYESPLRMTSIINYLEKLHLFNNERIIKLTPKIIDDSIIKLAHSQYYIDIIKRLSNSGHAILGEDIFITKDTLDRKLMNMAINMKRKLDGIHHFILSRYPIR